MSLLLDGLYALIYYNTWNLKEIGGVDESFLD